MTPDQIHPDHTYELTSGTRWTVKSFIENGRSIIITDGEVTTYDTPHNFARYAVRDVTPAPESDQGEKVAQAQSQGPSRGCCVAELTADDWLQIEMAAKGCVSGRSNEWPALVAAINKIRSQPLSRPMSAAWLQGFCEAVIARRCVPPAAAVNAELLAVVRRFIAEWDATWVDPDDINHDWAELYSQARAAIARAEAVQ